MNSELIVISIFYYLIIIYMKFSKVLEYLKDIRVLSILLIAIFILGFAYSKCTEGMTVEQLEQTRDDFDQSIHDPSFNELSEEEKRAASDDILTQPTMPSVQGTTTEPTEAEKRAEADVIDGKLSTICPEGCNDSCPNADLKCLQSMHPRCVNCEAKMRVGDHKIVGNIGDSKPEMPVINININSENSKGLGSSAPTPFSALESYNISKKGQLTDDTASNTNNMFGSNQNPSNIRSSDVTPKSSTGMINTSQVEIDNK